MDTKPRIACLHCGGVKFWRVPAKSRYTTSQEDLFDLLLGRAGALLKDSWVDMLVCRRCGVALARVADLDRFANVAARPESGIEEVEFPRTDSPYR